MENQKSSGLHRNSEAENTQKTWENRPKMCFMQENCRQMSRQSSVDSYSSEQNRDIIQFTLIKLPLRCILELVALQSCERMQVSLRSLFQL